MVHTRLILNVNWLLNISLSSLYYKWLRIAGLVPQTFHNMVGHAVYLSKKKRKFFSLKQFLIHIYLDLGSKTHICIATDIHTYTYTHTKKKKTLKFYLRITKLNKLNTHSLALLNNTDKCVCCDQQKEPSEISPFLLITNSYSPVFSKAISPSNRAPRKKCNYYIQDIF